MQLEQVLELEIVRPLSSKRLSVLWIEVEAQLGSFVVGPFHCPLVSLLKAGGRLIYKTPQHLEIEMEVVSGMLVIHDNKAVIILDA